MIFEIRRWLESWQRSGKSSSVHSERIQASQECTGVRPCPICQVPAREAGLIGELDVTFEGNLCQRAYRLGYCACGELIYADPLPPPADLNRIYVETEQFSDDLYTNPERVAAVLDYLSGCLHRLLGDAKPQRLAVLEVGAGRSWMCRAAKKLQPTAITVAQDVSPEAAKSCEWVDQYIVGELPNASVSELAPFNIISLTHVVEHLSDPVAVIRHCKSLLAQGGTIFITAPHRPTGWVAGVSRIDQWRQYSYNHVPAHIQYFARGSMEKLAAASGCVLTYWSDSHEEGQAFEAWLR